MNNARKLSISLGDVVWAQTPTFTGFAKVYGVDRQGSAPIFYLKKWVENDYAQIIIEASENQLVFSAPGTYRVYTKTDHSPLLVLVVGGRA